MALNLIHWRHALDPSPILADPHVPLPTTLMGLNQRLEGVLSLLTTLSDEPDEEKQYGVAVAGMAVDFALRVVRHLGLGDDEEQPPLLNLKMAQMVVTNLQATVQTYLDLWRQDLRSEAPREAARTDQSPGELVIDPGTFNVSYKGKTCGLGNTKTFHLIERLNESGTTYLSLSTLMQDVWHGKEVSNEAVQRQVSTLRAKLRAAGIEGIDIESQPDHYRLILR